MVFTFWSKLVLICCFDRLAAEHDLECIMKEPFHDFYAKRIFLTKFTHTYLISRWSLCVPHMVRQIILSQGKSAGFTVGSVFRNSAIIWQLCILGNTIVDDT